MTILIEYQQRVLWRSGVQRKSNFFMSILTFLLLCILFFAAPVHAESGLDQLPTLQRGLNLSSWLANAPRQPLFTRDFAQIKRTGFDHIRLPFNPTYYGFTLTPEGGDATHLDFVALDRALALAEQYHLPVVLDVHPGNDFMGALENSTAAEDSFVALWKSIAEHYKNHSASDVVFELLNEPQYYNDETRWNRLSARVAEVIFSISPHRLVVIGAPHGSSIDGLSFLHPDSDPRLIYAFHFYEPYIVTHQGIHQGFEKKSIRFFRTLPYPSALAKQSSYVYAPEAPNPTQAARELNDYISAPWDASHIAARIRVAQDWATDHHAHILCGEFGVLRNHIDADSRYRWIKDARTALDRNAIGWELWDYADLFGIAPPSNPGKPDPVDGSVRMQDPQKGARVFEPQAIDALGLTPGAP